MAVALLAETAEEARAIIAGWVKDCAEGKSDRELEALGLALVWSIDPVEVRKAFADARAIAKARAARARAAAIAREPLRRMPYDTPEAFQRRLEQWRKQPPTIELKAEEIIQEVFKPAKPVESNDGNPGLMAWVGRAGASRALVPTHNRLPAQLRQPITADIELPIVSRPLQAVELMNRKYAHIGSYGGKPQIMAWERWVVNSDLLIPTFQSLENFKNRYPNRSVEEETTTATITGMKKVPLGD